MASVQARPLEVPCSGHEIIDQEQPKHDYGFWFDANTVRWQEFVPALNNLTAIELFIQKVGDPGNLSWEIKTLEGATLTSGHRSISTMSGSVRIGFCGVINVIPGQKYRIYIYADQVSPSPSDRYCWRGTQHSNYRPDCANDVSADWPTYDYAFRTYGYGWKVYLPAIIIP